MPDRDAPLFEERVVIVFDVNIFLDVAADVGEPFTWEKFDVVLAGSPSDSARTVASLRSGTLPDGCPVEVWTSDHIDRLVALKASQPTDAEDERDRGLGWSITNAQELVDTLVADIVTATNGATVGEVQISYGTPPLSHEDGCVYATIRDAGDAETLYVDRICVTRDGHFLKADLPGLIDVMHPRDWMFRHQAASRAVAFKRILGR